MDLLSKFWMSELEMLGL